MIRNRISKHFRTRVLNELIHMPIVITVNKFDEAAARNFKEDVQKCHDLRQPIIPVMIDSYGGQVYSLLAMLDTIKNSEIPISTICLGKAMSCGAVLLTAGTEGHRYIGENGTVMIHEVSNFTGGKLKDLKIDLAETQRLNDQIFKIMARNCGKHEDYFLDLNTKNNHTDWYLSPQDALKHNVVNHIRIPNFEVKCSVSMKLV